MLWVSSTYFRTTNVVDVNWTVTVIITLLRLQSKLLITLRVPPPSDHCERWLPRRIDTILLLSWRLFDRSKNAIITNSTCIWRSRCIINYSSWTTCDVVCGILRLVVLYNYALWQTDRRTDVRPLHYAYTQTPNTRTEMYTGHVTCGQSCWVCTEHPIEIRKTRDRRTDRRTADTRQTRRHLLISTRAKYFQFYLVTYFSVCA